MLEKIRKKENTLVIILLILIEVAYIAYSVFQFIRMPYNGSWTFKYDKNANLVCEELWYFTAFKPAQRISYEYDDDGNVISIDDEDIAYGEGDEYTEYGYKDGKLDYKIAGGNTYHYSYENSEYVLLESEDKDSDFNYRYELDDDGNVISIARGFWVNRVFNVNSVWCKCSYNQNGKVDSIKYYGGMNPDVFSYEYDVFGRYSKIKLEAETIYETALTAEFDYKMFSKDYTAYVYTDERELIGTYEYKYNIFGNLQEVLLYKNTDSEFRYSWDSVSVGF